MAAVLDSESVFKERAREIGMSETALNALRLAGTRTLAKLAFSCSYQLGMTSDAPLIQVLADALGAAPGVEDSACLRRLFFEATTASMSHMKDKIERTEEHLPRRLPQPERNARYNRQVARLTGLVLEGELECSHGLIDEIAQQREDDAVRYLAPDRCGKRDTELENSRKSTSTKDEVPVGADTSTEMRIRAALTRRALAYDQCGLMSYECLNSWTEFLFTQILRSAPVGYASVTMQQALQADKALFQVLARTTRNGIGPNLAGVKPLEVAMQAARSDPQVAMLLMPMPGGSSAKRTMNFDSEDFPKKQKTKGKGKGKDKIVNSTGAKGKGQGKGSRPLELKGMYFRTPSGDAICSNFNLSSGCDNGPSCRNGKHVCAYPKCQGQHSLVECPKKSSA